MAMTKQRRGKVLGVRPRFIVSIKCETVLKIAESCIFVAHGHISRIYRVDETNIDGCLIHSDKDEHSNFYRSHFGVP